MKGGGIRTGQAWPTFGPYYVLACPQGKSQPQHLSILTYKMDRIMSYLHYSPWKNFCEKDNTALSSVPGNRAGT